MGTRGGTGGIDRAGDEILKSASGGSPSRREIALICWISCC